MLVTAFDIFHLVVHEDLSRKLVPVVVRNSAQTQIFVFEMLSRLGYGISATNSQHVWLAEKEMQGYIQQYAVVINPGSRRPAEWWLAESSGLIQISRAEALEVADYFEQHTSIVSLSEIRTGRLVTPATKLGIAMIERNRRGPEGGDLTNSSGDVFTRLYPKLLTPRMPVCSNS